MYDEAFQICLFYLLGALLKNCHIQTGKLFEATPDYLFTDPIPHKIGDSEETPTIDRLFSEWVAPEKVKLLFEIAAYCIYNGYPIHRMFILFGSGRNGKGQFRDLLVNLVGRHNRTASTLEQLINSRFETARLFNRKICTMGEINYSLLDRTAILKMLSGGDPIPAEMKNKAPFDYVNTAKLLINTNSLPQTSDKTDAFYSRCVLVEFVKQFQLGKNIIETIPADEYDNFLTKSLRVLRELLDRGEFTNEGDIRAKEAEYERVSNPLTQFINTFYEKDPNGTVAAWRLMEGYVEYCVEKGFKKPHSKNEFNDMLKRDYDVEKKNIHDEITQEYKTWVWVFGIKPKILSVLSKLSEVPVRSLIEKTSQKMDKIDKTDKNNLPIAKKSLSNDTIIEAPETDKTKQPVTELRTGDLTGDIQAFFEPYIRMGNPDTKTEMDWRSMVAINQITTKLKLPRSQAQLVWEDYCKQRNWPSPRPPLGNGTASPAPAPALAPAPVTSAVKPIAKTEGTPPAVDVSERTCAVCNQPLGGEASEFLGINRGSVHLKCKNNIVRVRALRNVESIDPTTHAPMKIVKDGFYDVPAISVILALQNGLVEMVQS
jgi:P4 family phage/plasmid primase-like protien